MNGFLHANDITPNKLQRHAYTLPLSAENGRMMGTCQISTSVIKGRQEGGYSEKVVNKEHLINGLKEAQAPSISSTTEPLPISLTKSLTKSSDSCAQTDQIAQVSRKQPHPDSKYLLESTNSQAKKPEVGLSGVDETPMVWSEALQIETVDVYALPYVIPY
ncbi:hypothetical protein OIU76_019954 [Salix suchowensis]|nr:hypothetical protein OIU76_019954 [Salix suchowensis]